MKSYPIQEHFYSLQGEGANAGKAAYFLRLSGCHVRCSFCDSMEAWDETPKQRVTPFKMAGWVSSTRAENIVITGGEPLLHDLDTLCKALRSYIPNVYLWLETSGTNRFSGDFDWVCLSPKKHYLPLAENYAKADELKVIIEHPNDFAFAEKEALKVNSDCQLFLQTEWSKRHFISTMITDYILENPKWQLSVQVHKYLEIL
ncbi:MAG: 7-carboxy-7-deazaguanine synthase QueE [Bacteroidales bacterium]|jgi:organic radical activating enzyme|nr:7-carboxy-7-deazaguanine synthase QueE [Bacteroidales bacterium]